MGNRQVSSDSADGTSQWSPIVIDRPVATFAPRPPEPESGPYRPDTVCDAWSTGYFTVRLASVRGYEHRYVRMPRQDHAAVIEHPATGTVIFAVADGVSSAKQSHIGSTLACEKSIETVLYALDVDPECINWDRVIRTVAGQLAERAQNFRGRHARERTRAEELFATTLLVGVVQPPRPGQDEPVATMVRVGDTSAWLLRDRSFQNVFDPAGNNGSYLLDSAVVALPQVLDSILPWHVTLPQDGALLIGTDGFGGPLGDGSGPVGQLFVKTLTTPPPALELAYVLDFSRETFDDDRTLVAIWPIPELGNARGEQ